MSVEKLHLPLDNFLSHTFYFMLEWVVRMSALLIAAGISYFHVINQSGNALQSKQSKCLIY